MQTFGSKMRRTWSFRYATTGLNKDMKNLIKKLFCKHDYVFIRMIYGDEINVHNGKRHEYRCKKCGMYKWD